MSRKKGIVFSAEIVLCTLCENSVKAIKERGRLKKQRSVRDAYWK